MQICSSAILYMNIDCIAHWLLGANFDIVTSEHTGMRPCNSSFDFAGTLYGHLFVFIKDQMNQQIDKILWLII